LFRATTVKSPSREKKGVKKEKEKVKGKGERKGKGVRKGVKSAVGFLLLTGKRWWIFARCYHGAIVSIALPRHHRVHPGDGKGS